MYIYIYVGSRFRLKRAIGGWALRVDVPKALDIKKGKIAF